MVGINVPIPVTMAWHGFGGRKRSMFGDTYAYGEEGVRFYTKQKSIMQRWPESTVKGAEFVMPTAKSRSIRSSSGTPYSSFTSSHSSPIRIAHGRIEPIDIRLNLRATSLVHNLASHRAANVGEPIAGRRQFTPDAMHAFTEDHLYHLGSLVQNHEVQALPALGYTYLDFLVVHQFILSS
jgi:hypothetical protein